MTALFGRRCGSALVVVSPDLTIQILAVLQAVLADALG